MDENEFGDEIIIRTFDMRTKARKHTKWSLLVLVLDGVVTIADALGAIAVNALRAAEQHTAHIEEQEAFFDIVSTKPYVQEDLDG